MTTNRWLPVIGGILMNLALGSLYGWSVFVLPLEKEFGWVRADTSLVYTIAIVCFALSFIVAGRIQDLKGPKICAVDRRRARQRRLPAVEPDELARHALPLLRRHRRHRQRLRLRDADAGRLEVVSRQARVDRRPDGRRLWRRLGDLRTARRTLAHPVGRMAHHVPDPRRGVLRDDDDRNGAAEEPACRLPSAELDAAAGRGRVARRFHDARDARDADVLLRCGSPTASGRRPGR